MSLADDLWALTIGARWFGGGGRGGRAGGFRSLDPACDVQSVLLDVAYGAGSRETYHVPLLSSALPRLVEAADEGLSLWRPFAEQAPGFALLDDLPAPTTAKRFAGEQSNTNVFFDNATMLKVLRRVEPGGGIEAELLEVLRGSGVAPELHGTWNHDDVALGVLVETLVDPEDGFDVAKDAAARAHRFDDESFALGRALATVHERLAAGLATGVADSGTLATTFRSRFDAAASEVPDLARFRGPVHETIEAIGEHAVATQRIHGDCHLGQVLRTEGAWRYVDFEGEPMKGLAERRALDSPLRDVAGMLRSYAYAAALGGADAAWLSSCREAFLAGYGVEEGPVLAAYQIDKAVYEALYESRFRPQLLHVPLAAFEDLAR